MNRHQIHCAFLVAGCPLLVTACSDRDALMAEAFMCRLECYVQGDMLFGIDISIPSRDRCTGCIGFESVSNSCLTATARGCSYCFHTGIDR